MFASGKNRTAGELHTNFQLAAAGGYLALVKSDGRTVADEYDPGYPEQLTDISYGLGQSAAQFITSGSTVSYHVPLPEDAERDWTAVGFNDDGWPTSDRQPGLLADLAVGRAGTSAIPPSPAAHNLPTATTFMVFGDGADIGGSADSFYYLYMPIRGDGELTALVMAMVDTDRLGQGRRHDPRDARCELPACHPGCLPAKRHRLPAAHGRGRGHRLGAGQCASNLPIGSGSPGEATSSAATIPRTASTGCSRAPR